MRTRPLQETAQPVSASDFYGSTAAGKFLKDAIAGIDSLDVVTIGDSNTGNGNYGYTTGLNRCLSNGYGIPFYATPLFPGSLSFGSTSFGGNYWQAGVTLGWCGDKQAGASGTVRTLVQAAADATVDSDARGLQSALTYNASNLPLYNGFSWYGAYVAAGAGAYHSSGYNNFIELATTHPLNYGTGAGGSALSYRAVTGTFNSGSGQFKLAARNHSDGTIIQAGSYTSTNTNSYGYTTPTPLSFTTPTTTLKTVRCGWDGFASGNATTGPFACLWHSITAQSKKGVSVSNFIYHGGTSPAALNTELLDAGLLLTSYLKELRDRQVSAGGSGRVLIFVNMGINSNDNSANDRNGTNYISAAESMISTITSRWSDIGGIASNLAFVFTVTHPTRASGVAAVVAWASNRTAFSAAVNAWARSKSNVSVVDIGQKYPSTRLANDSLYDSGGDSHLNSTTSAQTNGYDAAVNTIVASLIASA